MKILRRGQSTLEYVIILAAVVGAIILVANTLGKKGGTIETSYNKLGTEMQKKVNEVKFK